VGLQWRRRTSLVEPVAPTPSYSAARQGPHQPSNVLGVPDPDASQGPPIGGEINPTWTPLVWSTCLVLNRFVFGENFHKSAAGNFHMFGPELLKNSPVTSDYFAYELV
jgi:hypothetical protein